MGAEESSSRQENTGGLGISSLNPSSYTTAEEIRKESLWTWIKNVFCPNFKYTSVIFILTCLDIAIYIITLLFGIKRTPNEILAPTFETLDRFGMKNSYKIYHGQIHRLILFGLLHANLVHLISNLISQIILGSIIEGLIGNKKTGYLYLLSNVFGGLFSCVMNYAPGVGASVAIYGLLGAYFGFFVINYNYLKSNMNYIINFIFIILIVVMNCSFGAGNETIDNYGHIGGFIYGFLFIFLLLEPKHGSHSSLLISFDDWKKYVKICIFGSIILLSLTFWIFERPKINVK